MTIEFGEGEAGAGRGESGVVLNRKHEGDEIAETGDEAETKSDGNGERCIS